MKKIILIIILFITYNSFAQTNEINEKIINQNINNIPSQNIPVSGNLNFTYNFSTGPNFPIYNRVFNTLFDSNNLCQTQGTLSNDGSDCYYAVIKITVTEGGDFDIIMTSTSLNETIFGSNDSYFSLYCDFDPNAPQENLILTNDDGGTSFMPAFYGISLSAGDYYLVVTSYDSYAYGDFEFEVRSYGSASAMFGGSSTVPVNKWWIASIFMLIGIVIVGKRFFF